MNVLRTRVFRPERPALRPVLLRRLERSVRVLANARPASRRRTRYLNAPRRVHDMEVAAELHGHYVLAAGVRHPTDRVAVISVLAADFRARRSVHKTVCKRRDISFYH